MSHDCLSVHGFILIYRLDSGGGIRVGDFGLAEDVYASGYFKQNDQANVKLPYKWMALIGKSQECHLHREN